MGAAIRKTGIWLSMIALVAAIPMMLQAQATQPAMDLHRAMEQLNRSYRQVKAGVSDKSKNAATLASLATMQSLTMTAKGQVPESVTKLPEADRAKKTAEYRKSMVDLLRAELELEQYLLADDNAKAAEMIAKIDAIQKAGHTAFRVE